MPARDGIAVSPCSRTAAFLTCPASAAMSRTQWTAVDPSPENATVKDGGFDTCPSQ